MLERVHARNRDHRHEIIDHALLVDFITQGRGYLQICHRCAAEIKIAS
jgi:hypothetical protein